MPPLPIPPVLATTFVSAFAASAVEAVEAFTIVLAVAVIRGWRPAALGAIAAVVLLAVAVAALGPLLARAPVHGLQLAIGVLLLVFGLGWLRKAILRAGGRLPMHDEADAFAGETAALRQRSAPSGRMGDWLGGLVAFKAVLLEGTEVTFIVLAIGARPGLIGPAALGAAAACALVAAVGLALRAPLTRVPENALKFLVGGLLTGFGVFWCAEGLGAAPTWGDWAIPALVGLYLGAGALFAGLAGRLSTSAA